MVTYLKGKKFLFIVLTSFFLVLAVFSSNWDKANAEVIKLTAITAVGGAGPPAKLAINMANEKYKGEIHVDTVSIPWKVQFEKTMAEFVGRSTTYDIIPIFTWWLGATSQYMEDVAPYVKKFGVNLDVFPPGLIKYAKWEGKLIGLPFRTGSTALFYYRKDLYDKYGLKVPGTMEEYYHNAKVITENEKGIYGGSLMSGGNPYIYEQFLVWFWSQGGRLLNEEQNGTVPFEGKNGKLATDIFTMWKRLHDDKLVPAAHTTWGIYDILRAMQQNLVAQASAYSPRVLAVEDPKESKTVGKWGYSPIFPGKAGKVGPVGYMGGTHTFGINPLISEERKEAAFKVIMVMVSDEAQKRAALETANGPTLKGTYKDPEYLNENPAADATLECLDKFSSIVVAQGPEISTIISEEGGYVISGKKTPEAAARSMWKRTEKLFKE